MPDSAFRAQRHGYYSYEQELRDVDQYTDRLDYGDRAQDDCTRYDREHAHTRLNQARDGARDGPSPETSMAPGTATDVVHIAMNARNPMTLTKNGAKSHRCALERNTVRPGPFGKEEEGMTRMIAGISEAVSEVSDDRLRFA